jgi:hypothetical protein
MEEDPQLRRPRLLGDYWSGSPPLSQEHCVCRESSSQGRVWCGASKGTWLHTAIALLAWSLVVTALLATIMK